jgi:hypothetical protein
MVKGKTLTLTHRLIPFGRNASVAAHLVAAADAREYRRGKRQLAKARVGRIPPE